MKKKSPKTTDQPLSPAPRPTSKKAQGFLERVIQYGVDARVIDFSWIRELEQRLLPLADDIADRQTCRTSPSEMEIVGGQRRASQYLSWALEKRSDGQVETALAQLRETELEVLVEEGEDALEVFRSFLKKAAQRLERVNEHLSAGSLFSVSDLMVWCEESLEEAGRQSPTLEAATAMLSGVVWSWHELQVGECLHWLFPSFFANAPDATYVQCLEDMAVALFFGRDKPRVSLQEIRSFTRLAFSRGVMRPEVNDALLNSIDARLENVHCDLEVRQWFRTQWWPELVQSMAAFGGSGGISEEDCFKYGVFYPFGRRKGAQGPSLHRLSLDQAFALAERFHSLKAEEQLELLCTFEALTAFQLLGHLEEHGKEGAAEQLFAQLPTPIAVEILHVHRLVDDADFDIPDPQLPRWALSYLRSLEGTRKGVVRRVFRAWRKRQANTGSH